MLSSATDAGTKRSGSRRLQARSLFAKYGTVLLLAFACLLAVGTWASYAAYAGPGEATERKLQHDWTATGDLSHRATVTDAAGPYANGTVLEDEQVYFETVTPEVDARFVAGYAAESGENVRVSVDVTLVYRAVDVGDGSVYWSERERLVSTSEDEVAPGENVTAAFAVDVPATRATIEETEAELGASPGQTEMVLEVTREVEGVIEGDRRRASDQFEVPIEPTGSTYRIRDEHEYDETYEEFESVTVTGSPGPTWGVGGPLSVAIGILGIVGVVAGSRRLGEPTPSERDWLAYLDDRDAYDELIAPVKLPPSELDGRTATVDTLATLGEIAIDADSPLLFDRRTGRFVVRHEGLAYVFEPPERD